MTPAEMERIAILAEECAEVQQICMKILRHGYTNYHPNTPSTSNRYLLEKELGHVENAISMMVIADDISNVRIMNHSNIKRNAIKKYLHHQEV